MAEEALKGESMKNAGMAAALAGVFTICLAVGSQPMSFQAGAAGIALTVIGLAMILYQSYRDEEVAEIQDRRERLFRTWRNETDLRKE